MGIQMAAVIGGTVWLGQFIDNRQGYPQPWFTIGLGLVGVFVGIYIAVKPLLYQDKE
ncbi:MAG: AtpZ/AtpI family protein [Bacteroidetes bacterium]|jgi:F0F1-type ATP synthase assembly protein I|nr:AtpZ/AtpI family protein [Bacteroidota bacterium]